MRVRVIDWVLLLGGAGDECEDVESIEGRCAWVDLEREKKPLRKKGLCSSGTIGKSFFEEEEGLDNMENVGKQMYEVNKGELSHKIVVQSPTEDVTSLEID